MWASIEEIMEAPTDAYRGRSTAKIFSDFHRKYVVGALACCLSILVLLRSGMGSVPNATKAHSSCWYVSFVAGGKQLLPLDHPEAAAFSQSTMRKVTGRAVGKRERLKFDKEWSSLTSTVPGYFIWNDK